MNLAKRTYDLFWTIPGLIVLSPLFLMVALLIKLEDAGPIFFRQERLGLRAKPFHIWKFRTMIVDAERHGKQLTVGGDPRITRVGAWLRRTKLDELPQLFNVLLGEMSLVGPRPEVAHYVEYYSTEQRRVLDLPPGITDPASVRYHNESEVLADAADPERTYVEQIMPEKIAINLAYARKASVWSDTVVILNTFVSLLR